MSDPTSVEWVPVASDDATLVSVVLNESDPIMMMVRRRIPLPPCYHANVDEETGICRGCGWVRLSSTAIDTREPRRDDNEHGGASRPEQADHG